MQNISLFNQCTTGDFGIGDLRSWDELGVVTQRCYLECSAILLSSYGPVYTSKRQNGELGCKTCILACNGNCFSPHYFDRTAHIHTLDLSVWLTREHSPVQKMLVSVRFVFKRIRILIKW